MSQYSQCPLKHFGLILNRFAQQTFFTRISTEVFPKFFFYVKDKLTNFASFNRLFLSTVKLHHYM